MNISLYCPETEKKKLKCDFCVHVWNSKECFFKLPYSLIIFYYFVLSIFHKKKIQKFNDSSVSLYDEAYVNIKKDDFLLILIYFTLHVQKKNKQ